MTSALDPILRIARESGAHVLLVHHAKKGGLGWGGDAILGSTAILGSVDTALILKRGEKYRTLESIQRYGTDLEETSETFVLFGDPAMTLKIPLPLRPTGFAAQVQVGGVALNWDASTDCNGNDVAGYNLYRSTINGGPYTMVNTELITETMYLDTGTDNGNTYYYVLKAVDADGDEESLQRVSVSPSFDSVVSGHPSATSSPSRSRRRSERSFST